MQTLQPIMSPEEVSYCLRTSNTFLQSLRDIFIAIIDGRVFVGIIVSFEVLYQRVDYVDTLANVRLVCPSDFDLVRIRTGLGRFGLEVEA